MNIETLPSVSAVIVTYNGLRWLPGLFDSLLPQLAPYDAQVLLVDNGSTDGSGEFARARYPQVTVLPVNPNRGPIPAINRGLARARGEWIFVLNDDLEFQPGAVAAMMAEVQDQPSVGIASPVLLDKTGALAESYGYEMNEWLALRMFFGVHRHRVPRTDWETLPAVGRWRIPYVQGACLLVRKSALDSVGFMDENFYMYFDEVDWCRRFRQAGWRMVLLRGARVVHFGSPSIINHPQGLPLRQTHWNHASRDYFMRKHYGRRRAFVVRVLFGLTFAKAMISLWLRSRLPRVVPGAITLDHDSYVHTLALYRSMIRDVLRACGRVGRA